MNSRTARTLLILAALPLLAALTACSQVYFAAMEKAGIPKREILVDRVGEAQTSQQEVSETFADALEAFRSVVQFTGGDLDATYAKLSGVLERSEAKANEVSTRIDKVEEVSKALFREWKNELKDYNDPALRRSSEQQLIETEARYANLMRAMRNAEARMEPVLVPLRDRVLFLKHNLNAMAIGQLEGDLLNIEDKVDALLAEMRTAIAEADTFIQSMN